MIARNKARHRSIDGDLASEISQLGSTVGRAPDDYDG
jgi:hypothetical protein